MVNILEKSLLLRLGLAMTVILGLAFSSMVGSVFVADVTEGQAAAINKAGSMRMQVYRMSLVVSGGNYAELPSLIRTFEQTLEGPVLTGALHKASNELLTTQHQSIQRNWFEEMRLLLQSLQGQNHPENQAQQFISRVAPFVDAIDGFVYALERDAESKIRLLRMIQIGSLFLTLPVVFLVMYVVSTDVLGPLRQLLQVASAVGRGDFSYRIAYQARDELGQVSEAFNRMSEELSRLYGNLEERVQKKTKHLERSNRSLDLLYQIASSLHQASSTEDVYRELLDDIQELLATGPGMICLGKSNNSRAYTLASSRETSEGGNADICVAPACDRCFKSSGGELSLVSTLTGEGVRMHRVPIADRDMEYGVLLLEIPANRELEQWQTRLLEAVADQVAMSLKVSLRTSGSRRLALLEERSVIARELHDSLAQSLSYLKIQVSRLDALLQQQSDSKELRLVNAGLRDGLNGAYRQLRELLATFRLRMDTGLSDALNQTIQEFQQRSTVHIELNNQLVNLHMDPSMEIHVIQVVRESLSNVERHANASKVRVSAVFNIDGDVVVTVDDDGIGWSEESQPGQHYGLTIMRERANSLDGNLELLDSPLNGARVELRFNVKQAQAQFDSRRLAMGATQ